MLSQQPERIVDSKCLIGENPLWHPDENVLYWVDIPAGQLLRFDPAGGFFSVVYEHPEALGGFTIQQDGTLLLFMARGAVAGLHNGRLTFFVDEWPGESDSRFNDVIADPEGRVFCGTMSSDSHPGRLYRIGPDGKADRVLDGIGTSNGMGFDPGTVRFYHTDTRAHKIFSYTYSTCDGGISDRRTFVHVTEGGRPDGMTVDREGYVWSAMWEGASVVRYAPDGSEDTRVALPARKVTSVTFGGEGCTDLYITTAGGDNRDAEGHGAGALFRLKPPVPGKAEYRSNIPIQSVNLPALIC